MTEYLQNYNYNQQILFFTNETEKNINHNNFKNFIHEKNIIYDNNTNTPNYHPSISMLKELLKIFENDYKKFFETLYEIHNKKVNLNDTFTNFEIIEELREMVMRIKQMFKIIFRDIHKSTINKIISLLL